MRVLIQGGYVVGFNGAEHEVIRNGVVVFENDQILFVGKQYPEPVERRIDAQDCLISPGFIDTHLHSTSNAGDYLLTEADKPDFFASNYLAYGAPLKGKTQPHHLEDIDLTARFSLIHTLKGGATTVVDVGGPDKEPELYVKMVGEVGVRCFTGTRHRNANFSYDKEGRLHYDWSDERGKNGLKKAVDFAKKFNGANKGRLVTMLFPGQVETCTPDLLKQTKKAARELGVQTQIHGAMNLIEFHTVMQSHRCTSVELLHKVGFLGPEASISHCIFLNGHSWTAYPYGNDLKILADSGASVSHCPLKYLTLGVAMESFDRYIKTGINVSLGTDTYPKDMISEMRYAALASRLMEKSFLAGHPRDVFNAATLSGAKLVGREDLGRLAKGARADIVVIGLKKIAFGAIRDPIKSLVEAGTSRDVQMVIVDGEILVSEGRYVRANEEELIEKLQARAEQIWEAVPNWHWTGKGVDEIQPPAFKLS